MPFLISAASKIKGILFDLDGTLLDTAADLAEALNQILRSQHSEPLPIETIRPFISSGIFGLLNLGLKIQATDPIFPVLRAQFLDYYRQHSCVHTQLFPGIEPLIHYLHEKKWPWGIVTNKSQFLTQHLIKKFPLLKKAHCIIAGDTLNYSKPHPEPLLHACQCINCSPKNCIYVGDAKRDIDAANAAGMFSLIALYGFIDPKEDRTQWAASGEISSPFEMIEYLSQIQQEKINRSFE
ncbi:HAD family hydrolase [Rickettsiella grylli]|uniref:Phosphoglycolate phosphatase (PGPase) (PGP) n=1 Tax=Rickettsiella grylli TaxID=59196 RepID=A8PNX3_9COXI|nr:HAD-IA family hydrolase [Rickettsiella grylli]EDP46655.1 phosphoglycolate phosphatase (PGPase) (PGP) [Rickettsiella grylli]